MESAASFDDVIAVQTDGNKSESRYCIQSVKSDVIS